MSDRMRRWRLVLGAPADEPLGALEGRDAGMDRALDALYESGRQGALGDSSPNVARWLGDIRDYFPSPVVRVMQKDALDRLGLSQMLLEKEMLEAVVPDVHLVATMLSLSKVIPARTRDTARKIVGQVVQDLERRLDLPMRQAVKGALSRASRSRRPRPDEIDWARTIRANLGTWLPSKRTIVPERLVGLGRRKASLRDVILLVDQSGSMAASVVHASVLGAVLASVRAVTTRLVLFDTNVVDMTETLADPVDLLFGAQLGGGTDIRRALLYCEPLITRPLDTVVVLVSDLFEGGDANEMVKRAAAIVATGAQMICLLALDDRGAPAHDQRNAGRLAELGIPCFACTPELFPELMACALRKGDVGAWAARQGIVAARSASSP
jgi:hypothetical protein